MGREAVGKSLAASSSATSQWREGHLDIPADPRVSTRVRVAVESDESEQTKPINGWEYACLVGL